MAVAVTVQISAAGCGSDGSVCLPKSVKSFARAWADVVAASARHRAQARSRRKIGLRRFVARNQKPSGFPEGFGIPKIADYGVDGLAGSEPCTNIKVTKPATAATPIPITIGESNTPPPAAGAAPPPYLLIGSIASGLLAFR